MMQRISHTAQDVPMDAVMFRQQCRILGSNGMSERYKQRRGNALARLKAVSAPKRWELFAQSWKREEMKRRGQMKAVMYCRYFLVAVQIVSLLVVSGLSLYQQDLTPLVWLPLLTLVTSLLNVALLPLASPLSRVQRGMARLLMRQELEVGQAEIGYLVEMTEFPFKSEQEFEEIVRGSWRQLTRLLPTITQTDAVLLDAYHKKILRRLVVRAGQYLTNPKLPALRGVDADFAAAALVALSATGGWKETSREARAARVALQKIADTTPQAEEPVNHRYVRELARESLPLIQTGQK